MSSGDYVALGDGDDVFVGTGGGAADQDTVFGGEGNDTIAVRQSYDTVYGGDGNDVITSEDESPEFGDYLDGGAGNDTISGANTDDTIVGGLGDDLLSGFGNTDTLEGGLGNDTILGGEGDDLIHGDATAVVAGGNRITNGDFSNGMDGWIINNPSGNSTPTENGDGRASFNTGNETTFGDSIQQSFDANAGQVYQLSLNLYENGGGSGNHTFLIEVLDESCSSIRSFSQAELNSLIQHLNLKRK